MKQQRHIIKKQIIELNLSSQQGAFELQNEVSRIYRDKVIPLIDDLLSQFSDLETIHRINTLDINLGNIDINNLEQELIDKFIEEIKRQLEDKFSSQKEVFTTTINPTDISPCIQKNSQKNVGNSNNFSRQKYNDLKRLQTSDLENNRPSKLEILSYFLQTGTLPWWTENLSKQELEEYCDRLITNSQNQVKSIILESLKNAKQLQRLINQFPDKILLKIAGLFSTDLVPFIADYNTDIKAIFKQLEQTRNIPEAKLRLERWQRILFSLSYEGNTQVNKFRLIQANLLHISTSNGINYPEFLNNIVAQIEHLIREGKEFQSTLPELLENIKIPNQDTEFIREQEQAKLLLKELQKLSLNQQISPQERQQINQLNHQIEILLNEINNPALVKNQSNPITKLNQLLQRVQTLRSKIKQELNSNQTTIPEILDQAKIPNQNTNQDTEFMRVEEQAKLLLKELQKLSLNRQISPEDKQQINQLNNQNSVDTFSDSDEIYIRNAGLILLWPFLNRFFVKIGLVQKNIFIHIKSAQRASLLLQYLVDNSTEIPEYILPLNKILCGIDLLEPLEANLEITEQETAECENLLSAVIQNWSILKNTSIEGLRKAFLQRNGILRIRDGSWLLQVERETYDILLDKIPWSIRVIKLPWMDNILYVEW